MSEETSSKVPPAVAETKQLRKDIDEVLQRLKVVSGMNDQIFTVPPPLYEASGRKSRERSIAITKLQEAIMWLGMDLKALNEPNPYPQSYNPDSSKIEPTADGLKM